VVVVEATAEVVAVAALALAAGGTTIAKTITEVV